MLVRDTITEMTYWNIAQCIQILEEELEHFYRHGRGNPPSASKMLRRYGFTPKRKDKLIKAARAYLEQVDIIKGM